jgi:hypothetical protein
VAKFRTKPVVVDATQWFKHGDHPAVHRTAYGEIPGHRPAIVVPPDHKYGYVDTPMGRECVGSGDWIVTRQNGDIECLSEGKFEELYEPAADQ